MGGGSGGRSVLSRCARRLRRRISIGRLGRRKLGGELTAGRPIGRGEIVAEFHRVRRWDHPPAFVIEAMHGSKKSELLDHLRRSFKLRKSWFRGEEADAKVDFFAIAPEPESTFESVNAQLRENSNVFRRWRSPRFRRMHALFVAEQRRLEELPAHSEAAETELGWLEEMGQPVPPLVVQKRRRQPSSPLGEALEAAVEAWWRRSPTAAAKWVRDYCRQLTETKQLSGSPRRRIELLQAGLGLALAEDLRRATRRFVLPIGEVALFFDAYHRVEKEDEPNFVIDFFERIVESRARVMLVVACRQQTQWTRIAREQADCLEFEPMSISRRVQIHRLRTLSWTDCFYSLWRDGVPSELTYELAKLSGGMPVALHLLGETFGRKALHGDRQLLKELPRKSQWEGEEEQWFEEFSRILAAEILPGLSPRQELHLRAASTQRNFDRALLAFLLGEEFSPETFQWLTESGFVGTARPSRVLNAKESYRVRSFVRGLLLKIGDEGEFAGWRRLSIFYLRERADRTSDPDLEFQLEAEILYHELFIEPEEAKAELIQRFRAQLHASRTDRCETLLWIALRYNWEDPEWRATVLTQAGMMYLARNRNKLALNRLLEAGDAVPPALRGSPLATTIHLALARCYRLEERSLEARRELRTLRERSDLAPVVNFQIVWAQCRERKDHGELTSSWELTRDARSRLDWLLKGARREQSLEEARRHAIGSLPRKRFHIARHEADLYRRGGDYVSACERVDAALLGYEGDTEEGVELYTNLVTAHILRQEGLVDDSAATAFAIYTEFKEAEPRDLRGSGWALRCLAQAYLQTKDPGAASRQLEELATVDPLVYPRARPFSLLAEATIERRRGDHDEARRLLLESEAAVQPRTAYFESLYVELERMALDSIEKPGSLPTQIRQFLAQPGIAEHPTIAFSANLLGMRATRGEPALVDAARQEAERIRCARRAGSWELETLARTETAIARGEELPPLIFNLP